MNTDDYRNRRILLEFFDRGNHFHYNTGNHEPDENYRSLGYCTLGEAEVFCEMMQPLLSNAKHGEVRVTFERMQQVWKAFSEMLNNKTIRLGNDRGSNHP